MLFTLTIPVSGQQDGATYAILARGLLEPGSWVRQKTDGPWRPSAGFIEYVLLAKLLGGQTNLENVTLPTPQDHVADRTQDQTNEEIKL